MLIRFKNSKNRVVLCNYCNESLTFERCLHRASFMIRVNAHAYAFHDLLMGPTVDSKRDYCSNFRSLC